MKQTFKVYLSKILLRNSELELAGIGVLRLATLPSSISQDESVIFPPRDQIYLVPRDQPRHDPILLRVMQIVENHSAIEARQVMDRFMGGIHSGLRLNGEAVLPGLGKLVTTEFGEPYFVPNLESQGLNAYFGLPELKLPANLPMRGKTSDDPKADVSSKEGKKSPQAWGFLLGLGAILLILASFLMVRSSFDSHPSSSEHVVSASSDENRRLNVAPFHIPEENHLEVKSAEMDVTARSIARSAIIVGAFSQKENVDRMVVQLRSQGLDVFQKKGSSLTTLGFLCDSSQLSKQLLWAKEVFTPDAWVYKLPQQ